MTRLGFLLLAALAVTPALAQAPKPTAASIMDRYAAVSGGAAWTKVQSFTTKGTLTIAAQSISGTVEVYAKAPNKFAMKQNIKAVGESSSGFDGTVGWSKDPFSGLRVLAGSELAALKAQAALSLRPTSWKTVYSKAELLGTVKVAGAPAYRIKLTPKVGSPGTQYFDVKSGLQVRSDQVVESPQGKVAVESYLSDYRTVNGVKIPFKTRQLVGQAEVVLQFSDLKINTTVDDTVFAKPKE